MKFLCRLFGHDYVEIDRLEVIKFVIDIQFRCSRCKHKRLVVQRLAFRRGWFTTYGICYDVYPLSEI